MPDNHRHQWQALGFRHLDGVATFVVQSCECGTAREVEAKTIYSWQSGEPVGSATEYILDRLQSGKAD